MKLFDALSHRDVRQIWVGQVFSAVGDEVYGIALVWFTTALLGTGAGYLSAIQAASIFLFSLFGGVWMDHRDHRQVMIAADLVRGVAVLSLPLIAMFIPLNLWMLIPVAITVSGLSAFFGPALNATLPQLVQERELLQASNGLIETTTRLARVIGPGTVALLSRILPQIHYFTIDAVSFFISAFFIRRVNEPSAHAREAAPALTVKESLLVGHRLARSQPLVFFILISGAIAGAGWMFIFPLGMALMVREYASEDVGALGWLIFGYGLGNIASNVVAANLSVRRPERWVYIGRLIGAVGFLGLGLSVHLRQMMLAAAVAAVGGPVTDLGYITLMQRHFRGRDVARLFRYSLAVNYGFLLVVFLISPMLFQRFTVSQVIVANAILIFVCGLPAFRRAGQVT